MPALGYYLIAYLDILGQSEQLRALNHLPRTKEEEEQTIAILRSTALNVRHLRESFDHHFSGLAPHPDAVAMVPPEDQEEFKKLFAVQPAYRGFSDAVVITVPLAGPDEFRQIAALNAVHRALLAVSGVWLNFFATLGVAIRGGIDVGLGIELVEGEYYGRALVEAYLLERDMADYPRILVGDALVDYLASFHGESVSSERLRNFAIQTSKECRSLLVPDPSDLLLAVDPFWLLGDTTDPHNADYIQFANRALDRAQQLSTDFGARHNQLLAIRYRRLRRLLEASPNAPKRA